MKSIVLVIAGALLAVTYGNVIPIDGGIGKLGLGGVGIGLGGLALTNEARHQDSLWIILYVTVADSLFASTASQSQDNSVGIVAAVPEFRAVPSVIATPLVLGTTGLIGGSSLIGGAGLINGAGRIGGANLIGGYGLFASSGLNVLGHKG